MPKSTIQFYDNVNLPTTEREKIFKDKFTPGERVVIKIHFGEPWNKTAFTPEIVAPFIESLNNLGFETVLRDAPVFYGGPRATKEGYEQVIAEKGFTKLTTCEICDEYDTMPLHDGETAEVATILTNAKNLLVLTHVKGHPAAGFGATIKNIGIGAMSPKTKGLVHEMTSPTDERGFNQDRLGEVVAVAHQKMPANQLFVNIIRDVTKFCDCASEPGEIIASDIGTLISENLVAIDQASLDLLNQQAGRNLFAEENGIDPQPSIDACAKYSGLTKEYELVK